MCYTDYMMTDVAQTLRDLLIEIDAKIVALQRELQPLLREREKASDALRAITPKIPIKSIPASGERASRHALAHFNRPADGAFADLTIKELVVKVLREHYKDGAPSRVLLNAFSRYYGRGDILRTSLSPQLSRLKEDGIIELTDTGWKLVPNENGPPEGGPETGGAATPSSDSSPSLEGVLS
jgi:hypothetical protein